MPTPVPLRLTVCGLPLASSLTLSVALSEPTTCGVNVTEMLQLAPPARVVPHVFVWLKSPEFAPVMPMLVIASGALPVLVSVAVCALLVVPKV
jgi:hypothetical protein